METAPEHAPAESSVVAVAAASAGGLPGGRFRRRRREGGGEGGGGGGGEGGLEAEALVVVADGVAEIEIGGVARFESVGRSGGPTELDGDLGCVVAIRLETDESLKERLVKMRKIDSLFLASSTHHQTSVHERSVLVGTW